MRKWKENRKCKIFSKFIYFKGLHGKVRTKLLHEKVWHNYEAFQTFDVSSCMHACMAMTKKVVTNSVEATEALAFRKR